MRVQFWAWEYFDFSPITFEHNLREICETESYIFYKNNVANWLSINFWIFRQVKQEVSYSC